MQTTDTTIACTLCADSLQQSLTWIRRVTAENLMTHRLEGNTLCLIYRREAKPELEKIVAEEQRYCAFLLFSVRDLSDSVEIEIQAPESADPDARSHVDQFLLMAQQVVAPKVCGCAPGACG